MPQYPAGFEPIKKAIVHPEGFEPIVKSDEPNIPDNMPEFIGPEYKEPSILDKIGEFLFKPLLPEARTGGMNFEAKDPSQIMRHEPSTYAEGFDASMAKTLYDASMKDQSSPFGIALAAESGPIARGALGLAKKFAPETVAGITNFLTKQRGTSALNTPITPKSSEPVSLPDVKVNPVEGGLTTAAEVERMPGGPNVGMYGIHENDPMFPSVPSRMRGPGTNQTVFDALLPSRIKEQIGQTVKISEPVPAVLEKAAASDIPEISNAAKQVVELRAKDTSLSKATDPYIKSGISVLEKDSNAGKEISSLVQRTRNEGDQLAGGWSNEFKQITRGLNRDEWNNFVEVAEGKAAPISSKVGQAITEYRGLDAKVAKAAEDSGMIMSNYDDEIVPFKPVKEYWPRIYPQNFIESKKTDIFDALIKSGHAPEEAQKIIENSQKFGNRLISPQHAREADIGGYRTDRNAYLLHLDQMGKRIAESKNFGPRDLGDKASPLSQLVRQTKDSKYVTEILERHLGRKPMSNQAADKAVGKLNSLAAMTDLGLFTISNQAQKAVIPIRGNLMAFAKALTQFKTAAGRDFAEQSGALQTALRDSIQDLGGEHWVSRLYRTGASERSNRTLAAITGKFTAQSDFSRLRKTGDPKALKRLSDLLMSTPEDTLALVKSQEFLNDKQLLTAGARMSELTQGRAGTIDLPSAWRSSPEAKLMSMYKGYAFRQTKSLKDAALANPAKFAAVGLPLLALTGEAVGDTKAAVRGTLSSSKTVADEVANRGKDNMVDKILKSANTPAKQRWLASRVAEDLSEAWVLGILGDLIGSAGPSPVGMIKFIAGPVAGMASELTSGAWNSVTQLSPKPFAKSTVKTFVPTPFGYPASQADIFNKDKKEPSRRR